MSQHTNTSQPQTTAKQLQPQAVTLKLAFSLLAAAGMIVALSHGPAHASALSRHFQPQGNGSVDHSGFSTLLARYVVKTGDGSTRVNYRGLQAARPQLQAYLAQMQKVSVPTLSNNAAKAYWINLYNAKTLDVILEHYPVQSIRDIKLGGLFASGPWKKELVTVGGKALSLDDIEHEIARATWKDPRLHYGFNCASIGCPDLRQEAYRGKAIDKQLDQAARAFVNHPRGIKAGGNGVTVSSLYKWYKSDFGSANQMRAHWLKYANPSLQTRLQKNSKINDYQYDWSLNEAR
ncbi:DUF547 domain-containing protein [Cohaesibacter intestini]|uniref:DUF547 domain-containing protein n=1 Tax=Cohaesibacter intestini TaxID=2211145 RepID=UPI000DE90CDA|nr:DUF547 domain-containing protein [Cohaesibacter intestini]